MHKRITDMLDEGYRAMAADQARLTRQLGVLSKADRPAVQDAIKVQLGLLR